MDFFKIENSLIRVQKGPFKYSGTNLSSSSQADLNTVHIGALLGGDSSQRREEVGEGDAQLFVELFAVELLHIFHFPGAWCGSLPCTTTNIGLLLDSLVQHGVEGLVEAGHSGHVIKSSGRMVVV